MVKKSIFVLACSLFLARTAQATVVIETPQIEVTGVSQLTIQGACLDIELEGTESDTLRISGVNIPGATEVRSKKKGNRLDVWVEKPGLIPFGCDGKLVVIIPNGISVHVDNMSGDISAEALSSPQITLENAGGDIEIEDTNAEFEIKTASGSIEMDQCTGSVVIQTATGSIEIDDCRGNIDATSASAPLDFTDIAGDITAKSASGTINLEDCKGVMHIKTISGAIEGESITITGPSTLASTSGSIEFELTNPDDLVLELHSTSGPLRACGIAGSKNLKVGRGNMLLESTTISGHQEFTCD